MRLVVANPRQVRLDRPIAAPGNAVAMPVIGLRRSLRISRHHKDRARNHRAPARAGPSRPFRRRMI